MGDSANCYLCWAAENELPPDEALSYLMGELVKFPEHLDWRFDDLCSEHAKMTCEFGEEFQPADEPVVLQNSIDPIVEHLCNQYDTPRMMPTLEMIPPPIQPMVEVDERDTVPDLLLPIVAEIVTAKQDRKAIMFKYAAVVLVSFIAGVWFAPDLYAFKDKAQHAVNETHIQLPR